MMKPLLMLLLFICSVGSAYSQDFYSRFGLITKSYSSDVGITHLLGFQASVGVGGQNAGAFSIDLGLLPINTEFYSGDKNPSIYTLSEDTLVEFSSKGIFTMRFSIQFLRITRKKHEVSFGIQVGFDNSFGNRNNVPIEYDISHGLNSLNIGAHIEYHYYFNHQHSVFFNIGSDVNFFGVNDKSPLGIIREISGLKPLTGFLGIGYAFVFLRV